MASYVYITNPAKIVKFLNTLQEAGVPPKLTIKHLEALGFKSNNDRPLVTIMKAIGFVSSSGEPTEKWKLYRNKAKAPIVLAQGIREHYAELFNVYPDAYLKDNEALRNFFSTHTTVGAGALNYMIATFKALAGLADFKTETTVVSSESTVATLDTTGVVTTTQQGQAKGGFAVNINIELALPENATAETYDAFFKSMKKHLLG
jgi:hypothetical protein